MAAPQQIIFAVDDEPANLELVNRILADSDWLPKTYADPIDALIDAIEVKPAAMLVDYRMPGLNGVDLVRRLRKRGVQSAVLLVTAFPEVDEVVVSAQSGLVYLVVPKPVKPNLLKEQLTQALK